MDDKLLRILGAMGAGYFSQWADGKIPATTVPMAGPLVAAGITLAGYMGIVLPGGEMVRTLSEGASLGAAGYLGGQIPRVFARRAYPHRSLVMPVAQAQLDTNGMVGMIPDYTV